MPGPAWLTQMPRPAFMALGDSLLNGMRSYTINDALAVASVPALVGAALADMPGFAHFRTARYARPILFDVEAELRTALGPIPLLPPVALGLVLGNLHRIKQRMAANARDWMDDFDRGEDRSLPCFDNLALSGARIEHIFDLTLGRVASRLKAMAPVIEAEDDPLRWHGALPTEGRNWTLGDVHLSLNQRHLMNPGNLPGLDDLTPFDIVAARRPRALLIGLGPNHGLIETVMFNGGDEGIRKLRRFADDWPRCARKLAGLHGLEVLVCTLMPKPSQVPCLMPERMTGEVTEEPPPPAHDGYFPSYVSAIQPVFVGKRYTGAEVKAFDEAVAAVNDSVRAATQAAFANRPEVTVRFVDYSDLVGRHDFKHRRGPKLSGGASGRAYGNHTMAALPSIPPFRKLRGGLCGYDGIHPTGIAYRFVAEAVRQCLPAGWAPDAIEVSDADAPFIRKPHWPSLSLMDGVYPISGMGAAAAVPHPRMEEGDRMIFRPDWLRGS